MPWWLMLSWLMVVWILWAWAGLLDIRLQNFRDGTDCGFSILPIVPLYPLFFWGVAELIDVFIPPWGDYSIAALHGVFAIALSYFVVRDTIRLRSHTQTQQPR